MQTAASRTPWPYVAGGALGAGVVVTGLARRRRGPHLTGTLFPVHTPPGSALLLPRDLSAERRRAVYIGRLGKGEWTLPGWDGSLRLAAQRGSVSLEPVDGDVRVNDRPVSRPVALYDGATIRCGLYEFRYENLLIGSTLDA